MMGLTKYTAVTGELKLREAIVRDLAARKGVQYSPSQIVVANGAKQCVFQALMTVVGHGDSVLIPSPYWASYPGMCNRVPSHFPCFTCRECGESSRYGGIVHGRPCDRSYQGRRRFPLVWYEPSAGFGE